MQHRTTSAHRTPAADPETAPLTIAMATPARAAAAARRTPAALRRRPGVYLGVAAAGAVLVNLVMGVDPAAQAEADVAESVSVAQALGLTSQSAPVATEPDLQPLSDLAASRNDRDAAEVEAQQAQLAADQAVLDQQRAAAEAAAAAAQAEAEAAAAAEAAAEAAAAEAAESAGSTGSGSGSGSTGPSSSGSGGGSSAPAPVAAAGGTAASAVARINNTAGPIAASVQRAANIVVSNVPGAGSISLGGTRPSAADPGGHPSGKALDYMVMSNNALGDAITAYHIAHWDELGVEYIIWEQRILQSPGGSWSTMANRGSATANHFDHVHVNYN